MDDVPAPALGEPIAIEFANTLFAMRGEEIDALTTPRQLSAWLARHVDELGGISARGGRDHLVHIRELREDVRALLHALVTGGRPPAAAVARLNARSRAAATHARLRWPAGSSPALEEAWSTRDSWQRLLGRLASSAIGVAGGHEHHPVRRCEAPGCVLYFVQDRSQREWCSPACGNRARVARYYRRRRAA